MFQFVYLNQFQSDQNVLTIIMYHNPHDYFAIQIIKSFIIISGHKEVYICDNVNCLCLVFCLLVTNTFHHYHIAKNYDSLVSDKNVYDYYLFRSMQIDVTEPS